eukprot:4753369-Pyramimonas_sp.AAC.1
MARGLRVAESCATAGAAVGSLSIAAFGAQRSLAFWRSIASACLHAARVARASAHWAAAPTRRCESQLKARRSLRAALARACARSQQWRAGALGRRWAGRVAAQDAR